MSSQEGLIVLSAILESVLEIKDMLKTISSQQPAASSQNRTYNTITIDVDAITYAVDDNGQPAYKARGGMFKTYGIRIWPEVLTKCGIDPATLTPGVNPLDPPRAMIAELRDTGTPKKIIGLA